MLVLVTAIATVIVGLATGELGFVWPGLLVAGFVLLVDRMRGEANLALTREGLTASGTIVGPDEVQREALEMLRATGVTGPAADAAASRVHRRASELLPPDEPVTVSGSPYAYRRVSRALAAAILASECAICGRSAEDARLELAHVVAVSQGGQSHRGNLIALCADCHRRFDAGELSLPSV
jgi:HNH endonuclease